MTHLEEFFTDAHGTLEVARKLGLHQLTVERWRRHGIPYKWWDALGRYYKLTPEQLVTINKNVKISKKK